VLYQNLAEKHILFYFPDTTIQAAVEANNFAGRIQSPQGNYLHINDSNFGGAKSNMFITQEYNLDIKTNGDQSVVTLEMIYKNPMAGSNCNLEAGQLCLNGVLGNWQRVLLPQGSQLIEAKGYLDDSVQTSTVMDKTQIEGFFKLSPESQAKLTLSYSVPYVPSDNQYLLTIQKQPGTKQPKVTVTLNGQATTFDLSTDQTLTLTP